MFFSVNDLSVLYYIRKILIYQNMNLINVKRISVKVYENVNCQLLYFNPKVSRAILKVLFHYHYIHNLYPLYIVSFKSTISDHFNLTAKKPLD